MRTAMFMRCEAKGWKGIRIFVHMYICAYVEMYIPSCIRKQAQPGQQANKQAGKRAWHNAAQQSQQESRKQESKPAGKQARTAASTAASTETTDFATEPTTPTAPPPLPLQSVQCPLRAVIATDPAPAQPGGLDVAASKRKGVDEKEDEATTLGRWMAVPSRRAPASDGKKSKLEEGAPPMEEDSVTAID